MYGLCCTRGTALKTIDQMCATFDNKITSWKAAVEQQENIQVSALKQNKTKKERKRKISYGYAT